MSCYLALVINNANSMKGLEKLFMFSENETSSCKVSEQTLFLPTPEKQLMRLPYKPAIKASKVGHLCQFGWYRGNSVPIIRGVLFIWAFI